MICIIVYIGWNNKSVFDRMEVLDWINLAQDRDKLLDVETIMNRWASQTTGSFFTR